MRPREQSERSRMSKGKKGGEKSEGGILVACLNKKARHDYEILDTYEAGMVLVGSEVKSIRIGGMNLRDSFVREKRGELYLVQCHISPYTHSPADAHEPTRDRKLLLHHHEIEKLIGQITRKGLTLVPLRAYFKKGRCKLEFGVARGKKLYDKRQDVRKREANREMERAFRGPKEVPRKKR